MVWYSQICERQVWLIGHSIEPFQEHERLEYGRAIHELFYKRYTKEMLIDGVIKVDIIKREGIVAEVKTSSKNLNSAKMQLLYYLYYLKKEKGITAVGQILIPTEKRIIDIHLTNENERDIENILRRIDYIMSLSKPPKPIKISYCKACAYKEMCWA
ncbi:MAG: CRISPR-associated protein Cas4 [Candidatus Aenigmatarchaeota archaeon]